MSTETASELMTAEKFLALPDDGIDRDLIRGVVVVRGETEMTRRNRRHTKTEAATAKLIGNWVDSQRDRPGEVHSGEVGCILHGNTDSAVGIDVVFISAEHAARQNDETTMIDGSPLLAVEILSPSDKHEDIGRKVDDFLAYGVQVVWIVDTHFQTVIVHRPSRQPELFNADQTLRIEDLLPGLEIAVRDLF